MEIFENVMFFIYIYMTFVFFLNDSHGFPGAIELSLGTACNVYPWSKQVRVTSEPSEAYANFNSLSFHMTAQD